MSIFQRKKINPGDSRLEDCMKDLDTCSMMRMNTDLEFEVNDVYHKFQMLAMKYPTIIERTLVRKAFYLKELASTIRKSGKVDGFITTLKSVDDRIGKKLSTVYPSIFNDIRFANDILTYPEFVDLVKKENEILFTMYLDEQKRVAEVPPEYVF